MGSGEKGVGNRDSVGMVMGKFQPFHNDHLVFLKEAKQHCDFLVVFVGQLFEGEEGTVLRSMHNAVWSISHGFGKNTQDPSPFSYQERKTMIEDSLIEAGIGEESFEVKRTSLKGFLRTDGKMYLRSQPSDLFYKMPSAMLLGKRTEVIGKRGKITSGTELSELLRSGKPISELVPAGSYKVIQAHANQAEKIRLAADS